MLGRHLKKGLRNHALDTALCTQLHPLPPQSLMHTHVVYWTRDPAVSLLVGVVVVVVAASGDVGRGCL